MCLGGTTELPFLQQRGQQHKDQMGSKFSTLATTSEAYAEPASRQDVATPMFFALFAWCSDFLSQFSVVCCDSTAVFVPVHAFFLRPSSSFLSSIQRSILASHVHAGATKSAESHRSQSSFRSSLLQCAGHFVGTWNFRLVGDRAHSTLRETDLPTHSGMESRRQPSSYPWVLLGVGSSWGCRSSAQKREPPFAGFTRSHRRVASRVEGPEQADDPREHVKCHLHLTSFHKSPTNGSPASQHQSFASLAGCEACKVRRVHSSFRTPPSFALHSRIFSPPKNS